MTIKADPTRVGQQIKLDPLAEEEGSVMDDWVQPASHYGYHTGDGKVATIARAR
jgi:hypothetical protein